MTEGGIGAPMYAVRMIKEDYLSYEIVGEEKHEKREKR